MNASRSYLIATAIGGFVALHFPVAAAPPNDNFATRINLGNAATVNTTGNNTGATLGAGEINPGDVGGASVWYQWTAPVTGWVTIHTVAAAAANDLNTVIALYSGDGSGGLASLQMLGFNDESMRYPGNGYPGEGDYPAAIYPGGSGPSRLVFQATAGQVYQIAVHGYDDGSGAVEGPFELHIASEPTPGLRATALAATPSTVDVTGATQPFTEQVTFESSAPLDLGDPLTMTDGTDSISIGYNAPDGSRGSGFELSLNDRTSGTATNGTYALSFDMPRYSLPGAWVLSAAGTFGGINFEWTPTGSDVVEDHYLIPPPTAGTLTVVNTGPVDTTGPELAAFNVSSTTVNNSVADQHVTVTVTLTDDLSGVDPASGSVQLYNPIANSSLSASFADFLLISGTPQNGVYQGDINVPVGTPAGTYYWDVNVSDLTGNNSEFSGLPPPYSGTTDPLLAAKTLTVVVSGGTSISEALDTPGLTWSHNFPSRPLFAGQTIVTHDGSDAVRTPSGLTAPSGGANWQQLFAQVTGPGTLTFWWKKTGDAGQSQLDFDWSEVSGFVFHPHASHTGTFDWQQETVNITASGQVILNFTFAITATDTGTPEVAYIDQVVFTPSGGGGGFSGWKSTKFTPAELADPNISGPLADAEKDGIPNAVEYALGLEPKTNNPTPWQAGTQTVGPDRFQTIGFSVSSSFPADATLIVEEGSSLSPSAAWTTLATKAGSAAWVASNGGVITQGAPSGGRIPVTVRSPTAMGGANSSGFMRLRAQVP